MPEMRQKATINLRYKSLAKADWFAYLILDLFGFFAVGYAIQQTFTYPDGWQKGLFISLFAFPFIYLMGLGLVKRAFVWSQVTFDETSLTQSLFGHEYKIDLCQPWDHQYVILLEGHSSLRMPEYQYVEIRQKNVVVRLLPRWLTPVVRPDVLPISLQYIWQEYSSKSP